MDEAAGLSIAYDEHDDVREIADRIQYCVESISLAFDGWDEPRMRGPGLYFVIVAGTSVADYADPMGANRWPVEECRSVTADLDEFFDAASDVAVHCDGAVIVSVDGTILPQMVRMKDLTGEERAATADEQLDYADWMGARHMSAIDTSVRDEVVFAITLSEETGRVTVFQDGEYEDWSREQLGAPWRND
ncbi:diadenylate cyclase [Halarchaeum sp. P4]|uniref:diadenylate cyclase n=1 Tax=Halarchaeum sp. P4 TaxID=3421639 RepID=UPI003EBF2D1E